MLCGYELLPQSLHVRLMKTFGLILVQGKRSDLLLKGVDHDLRVASLGGKLKHKRIKALCFRADRCVGVGQLIDEGLEF